MRVVSADDQYYIELSISNLQSLPDNPPNTRGKMIGECPLIRVGLTRDVIQCLNGVSNEIYISLYTYIWKIEDILRNYTKDYRSRPDSASLFKYCAWSDPRQDPLIQYRGFDSWKIRYLWQNWILIVNHDEIWHPRVSEMDMMKSKDVVRHVWSVKVHGSGTV